MILRHRRSRVVLGIIISTALVWSVVLALPTRAPLWLEIRSSGGENSPNYVDHNEIVTSAYYTYAMLDPRITKITSGKPELKRPDILEDLFHDMNEIVTYIIAYREQEAKKKK